MRAPANATFSKNAASTDYCVLHVNYWGWLDLNKHFNFLFDQWEAEFFKLNRNTETITFFVILLSREGGGCAARDCSEQPWQACLCELNFGSYTILMLRQQRQRHLNHWKDNVCHLFRSCTVEKTQWTQFLSQLPRQKITEAKVLMSIVISKSFDYYEYMFFLRLLLPPLDDRNNWK